MISEDYVTKVLVSELWKVNWGEDTEAKTCVGLYADPISLRDRGVYM